MANYSVLKAAVQAVVKTNGNQEITGANMQSTLISIINSLGTGYQFMGVATPSTSPGTPDYNVAYIGGAGTYANFGTSVTVPVGSICVFKYNGSWTKEQIALFAGIDAVPTAGSDNLVKSGGVYSELDQLEQEFDLEKWKAKDFYIIDFIHTYTRAGDKTFYCPMFAGKKYLVRWDYNVQCVLSTYNQSERINPVESIGVMGGASAHLLLFTPTTDCLYIGGYFNVTAGEYTLSVQCVEEAQDGQSVPFEEGKAWNLQETYVTSLDTYENYRRCKIDASTGTRVKIRGFGEVGPRLWATADENGRIIRRAEPNTNSVFDAVEIVMQDGEHSLYVNAKTTQPYSSVLIVNPVYSLENETKNLSERNTELGQDVGIQALTQMVDAGTIEFAVGSLNSSGAESASTTQIRCTAAISTKIGWIGVPDGFLIHRVYYYSSWNSNSDFVFVGPYKTIDKRYYQFDTTQPLARFSIRKADNSAIIPDDYLAAISLVSSKIGTLANLQTTNKSNIVAAVNELGQEVNKIKYDDFVLTEQIASVGYHYFPVSVFAGECYVLSTTFATELNTYSAPDVQHEIETIGMTPASGGAVVFKATQDALYIGGYFNGTGTFTIEHFEKRKTDISLNSGYAYNMSEAVPRKEVNQTYSSAWIDCVPGQIYELRGDATFGYSLYCTIDKNGRILRRSAREERPRQSYQLTIQEGETAILYNTKTESIDFSYIRLLDYSNHSLLDLEIALSRNNVQSTRIVTNGAGGWRLKYPIKAGEIYAVSYESGYQISIETYSKPDAATIVESVGAIDQTNYQKVFRASNDAQCIGGYVNTSAGESIFRIEHIGYGGLLEQNIPNKCLAKYSTREFAITTPETTVVVSTDTELALALSQTTPSIIALDADIAISKVSPLGEHTIVGCGHSLFGYDERYLSTEKVGETATHYQYSKDSIPFDAGCPLPYFYDLKKNVYQFVTTKWYDSSGHITKADGSETGAGITGAHRVPVPSDFQLTNTDVQGTYIQWFGDFSCWLAQVDRLDGGYLYLDIESAPAGNTNPASDYVTYHHNTSFRLLNLKSDSDIYMDDDYLYVPKFINELLLSGDSMIITNGPMVIKNVDIFGKFQNNVPVLLDSCKIHHLNSPITPVSELFIAKNCEVFKAQKEAFYCSGQFNEIGGCKIHDVCESYGIYKAVQNSCRDFWVHDCEISDFGYGAIAAGRYVNPGNSIIENNAIYQTPKYHESAYYSTAGDGGAIYIGTYNNKDGIGCIIRNNRIFRYRSRGQARGIYGDDGACYCYVYNNIVSGISGGYGIDFRYATGRPAPDGYKDNNAKYIINNISDCAFRIGVGANSDVEMSIFSGNLRVYGDRWLRSDNIKTTEGALLTYNNSGYDRAGFIDSDGFAHTDFR